MKKSVYLCGTITSDPGTWEWRQYATEYLANRNIEALDPLRGKDLSSIKGLGFESNIPKWIYVRRDMSDIQRCDLAICNLLIVPERQMVGSFMEMGMFVSQHTPFIVVATHEHFLAHPFITELAVKVLPDVEEALWATASILS
jgi:nucleoside 2-deoxyribosyltransferase